MQDDTAARKRLVQQQFGAVARSYVTSAGHAQGGDLGRMLELAQPRGDEILLDIATGGGHTALAFAPHVREAVASDLTPAMLAEAEAFIRSCGAENVRFEVADAEALPFADAHFDLVTVRIAPHHFPNPQRFIAEVARVLRPGGRFIFNDNIAPEDDELDAFLNRFEQWRDPSHVRAWKVSEWQAWIEEAGMTIEHVEPPFRKRYDFADWTERMQMPPAERDALQRWLLDAPPRCAEAFAITVADRRVQSLISLATIIVARRAE
jgi:ubiquinone/menaquinone biosynthesis C-methylase UbiE